MINRIYYNEVFFTRLYFSSCEDVLKYVFYAGTVLSGFIKR